MKTRIRDSYTPKLGDYCNTFVIDKETGNQYLFDADGVWTLISTDKEGVVAEAVAQANAYTDDVAEGKVDKEEGKGLSENDFTDEDKDKLGSVEAGAQENVIEVVKRNGVALPVVDKTVDVTVPTATSALTNDSGYITNAVDNLVNYYDKDETDTIVETEVLTRDAADQDLQEQIDAIVASSDVVDIVGTYAELQNYDTSKLHDNDIIKVLTDETRDDATTYYRWDDDTDTFTYIGSEGPYYTKGEADATFVPLTRTINGKGLNSDVVLTAADVGALPSSTVIPTVNDATLAIQKNGSTVQTFTANQATNATANIIVPTKTSDLANDGSDNTSTYVESDELATVATSGSYNDLIDKPADFVTDTDYASANDAGVIKVGSGLSIDANGVLSSNGLASVDWSDVANKPTNVSYWANDAGYITSAAVPTKTSDLTNDSGFITSASVPTKTSDLTNDSGFITSSVNNLANYYKKSETYTQGEVNSLLSAIVIPTKTSDLTNDGSDGTSTYVEADDLATVATSGSYNDLSNKPTIPTVNNATLTIQKNSTNVATFTANASSNVTANIEVPTYTAGSGIDITNNVISTTANTFASYSNGTLYITNAAQNADTENF